MKKILAITGRRADYGVASSIFRAIHSHLDLMIELVVTGLHTSDVVGSTITEIEKDGIPIVAVLDGTPKDDSGAGMCRLFAKDVLEITRVVEERKPDLLFVSTDLDYALAGAFVGSHMNVPVVHLHGGDVSGTIDDSIRHAISKFSHVHFPASVKSANRIKIMGEEPWRVHVVGAPGLDFDRKKLLSKRALCLKLGLDPKKEIVVVIQHSNTTEVDDVERQIKETLQAIVSLGMQTVIIYPNLDPGGRVIIEEIEKVKDKPFITVFNNLVRNDYLSLLSVASVLVGNSSSGIIESAFFNLPVVNIGPVHLKRNCKIGSHSVVMPGVTVGENSVVGAFSFVNKSFSF